MGLAVVQAFMDLSDQNLLAYMKLDCVVASSQVSDVKKMYAVAYETFNCSVSRGRVRCGQSNCNFTVYLADLQGLNAICTVN